MDFPSVDFHPYEKKDGSTKRRNGGGEMLLHSTSHRLMDYTARESLPNDAAQAMRHFVGLFDPTSGKLELIEAKKMVVRGSVRALKINDAREKQVRFASPLVCLAI